MLIFLWMYWNSFNSHAHNAHFKCKQDNLLGEWTNIIMITRWPAYLRQNQEVDSFFIPFDDA